MKQPFEEGHAPREAYHRSPWTEPSFEEALGSCVPSFAVVIGLTTDDRRLISPVVSRTDTHADSLDCRTLFTPVPVGVPDQGDCDNEDNDDEHDDGVLVEAMQ